MISVWVTIGVSAIEQPSLYAVLSLVSFHAPVMNPRTEFFPHGYGVSAAAFSNLLPPLNFSEVSITVVGADWKPTVGAVDHGATGMM